jgi:hypothetical protein
MGETVRRGASGPGPAWVRAYLVVCHEYVHSRPHANFHWLPQWLDEGSTEFYGATYFEKSKVYVGAPTPSGLHLAPNYEFARQAADAKHVAYQGDDRRIDLFYAESRALVHYCEFGPDREQGKKLSELYRKVQLGEEQKQAAPAQ